MDAARLSDSVLWFLTLFRLFIFFPGFIAGIGNSVSCSSSGGLWLLFGCLPEMKPIGTCGFFGTKCCKRN
uniref:Beta-defensin-like domain-containing protein n=1 Tax=Equus asinus TaxID=9793 RepID=A0A8C4PUY2_EQUAS